MGDVLEVANVFTGVQINCDEAVRVEVVPRTERAVEVR